MKKTLSGILAVLLVLTMVLGGTLVVSAEEFSPYAGTIKDAEGVTVDGLMDDVYAQSVKLPINITYGEQKEGYHTRGMAYAVWNSTEQAIYFFIIINDVDVSATRDKYEWSCDGVELFLKRGNDLTLDYTSRIEGKFTDDNGDGKLDWKNTHRGRQYRINGYNGKPTALCEAEMLGGYDYCYAYDADLGRLHNPAAAYEDDGSNSLVSDNWNEFGWEEGGWAKHTFETRSGGTAGYTVEYKITLKDLAAGDNVLFDISVCDQYMNGASATANGAAPWYASAFRKSRDFGATAKQPDGHNKLPAYDYLTMGTEKVTVTKSFTDDELYIYGRENAELPEGAGTVKPPYVPTDRVTIDRLPGNAPAIGGAGSSSVVDGGDNLTTPAPGTTAAADKGGCSSSIVLGSSVAMLAVVGAAGAFAFRKKDEE